MKYTHLTCLTATALFGVLIANSVEAQVSIAPTTSFNGSLYTYSYSVVNGSAQDLAIANLNFVGMPVNLTNLVAPTGFGISYDPGVNIVSFFEDSDPNTTPTFAAGSTVSGFSFQSVFPSTTIGFDGFDVAGNTFAGNTQGPVAVPEASTLVMTLSLTTGMSTLLLRRRRR